MNWFTRLFTPKASPKKMDWPDKYRGLTMSGDIALNEIEAHHEDRSRGAYQGRVDKWEAQTDPTYKARYKAELEESRIKGEVQAAWDAVEAQKLEACKLELEAIRDRDHLKLCRKLGNPWSMPKGIAFDKPELKRAYLTPRERVRLDRWAGFYESRGRQIPAIPSMIIPSPLSGRGAGQ